MLEAINEMYEFLQKLGEDSPEDDPIKNMFRFQGEIRSMEFETFLLILFVWIGLTVISFFAGRGCSCYFPYLISAKVYYTVKHSKWQKIFISRYPNRTLDVKTSHEDKDKLPLLGCVYYSITIFLTLIGSISLIGFQISSIVAETPFYFLGNLFSTILNIYIPIIAVLAFLYRLDYYLGKRRNLSN